MTNRQAVMQERLDTALAEVQRLYGATTATADALTKAIPRQEAEDRAKARADEQKRTLFIVSGIHLLVMVLLFLFFTTLGVGWVRDTVERDHAIIECLSTTAETTKLVDPRVAITNCLTTVDK